MRGVPRRQARGFTRPSATLPKGHAPVPARPRAYARARPALPGEAASALRAAPPTAEPERPRAKPPLLRVEGHGVDRLKRIRLIAILAVAAIVGGSLFLIFHGDIPWLYRFKGAGPRRGSSTRGLMRLVALIAMGGAYVAERLFRGQMGHVDFHDDRIVFVKERSEVGCGGWWWWPQSRYRRHVVALPWGEVTGFKDDKREFVAILSKEGSSSFQTVPTLAEEDRVAVLKLLDEKGVPRVE